MIRISSAKSTPSPTVYMGTIRGLVRSRTAPYQ
jgi:hypothetical protein